MRTGVYSWAAGLVAAVAICGATSAVAGGPSTALGPDCGTVTADATKVWGANHSGVSAAPANASWDKWGTSKCDGFVADFVVSPATATIAAPGTAAISFGADDPKRAGGMFLDVPESACSSFVQTTLLFRKNGNGPYTFVAGGAARGVWWSEDLASGQLFNGCMLTDTAGFKDPSGPINGGEIAPFNPPSSGTETYRVVTNIRMNEGGRIVKTHVAAFGRHGVSSQIN